MCSKFHRCSKGEKITWEIITITLSIILLSVAMKMLL